MIYNESGEICLLYENNLVLLESIDDDINNKRKELENLLDDFLSNNKFLDNIKEIDNKAFDKIKKNIKMSEKISKIFEFILKVGFISIIPSVILKMITNKYIPLIISFSTIAISIIGGSRNAFKEISERERLINSLDKELDNITSLLEKIKKAKGVDQSISKDIIGRMVKIKSTKDELERLKRERTKLKLNNMSEINKFIKAYNLDEEWKKYCLNKYDYLRADNIDDISSEPDYGTMIGVVLSSDYKNGNTIIAECVLYGDDYGPYVGSGVKEFYSFKTSANESFDICNDGKSAYSYSKGKYVDIINDDGDIGGDKFGSGKYRFNFDIKDTDIEIEEGLLFYYSYGF